MNRDKIRTAFLLSRFTVHGSRPLTVYGLFSIESEPVNAVPLRRVGEDDRVALAQALQDLDVVDGGAAELDLGARGLAPVGADLEERDGRLPAAARRRAADVEYVLQALKFDGPVHAQVHARALRHRAFEPHVHGERAVARGRVDALDAPGDGAAAARVDGGGLAERDVLDLRLGNLERGLEARRVGDARDVGARRDLLSDLDRHLLQDARGAGPHLERGDLLLVEA